VTYDVTSKPPGHDRVGVKAAGWILLGWLGWSGDERGALIV
jgi:hypothetical protein